MRIVVVSLGCCLALTALGAPSASARTTKLSPSEQKWVAPLINVYNVMSAELNVVIAEELAPDALIAGSGKNNTALTKTLEEFVACSDVVKKAGRLPSARLGTFLTALTSSCAHLGTGAHNVAKAIGAVGKGKAQLAKTYLFKGTAEFKTGSKFLAASAKALQAVGGKSIFTA